MIEASRGFETYSKIIQTFDELNNKAANEVGKTQLRSEVMFRALWTAATGMTTQQKNIDTIANNLANVI